MTLFPPSPLFSLLLLLLAAQGLLLLPSVSEAVGVSTLPAILLAVLHGVALLIVLGILKDSKQLEIKLLAGWHLVRVVTEIWVLASKTPSLHVGGAMVAVTLVLATLAGLLLLVLMRLLLHRHGGLKLLLDALMVMLVVAIAAWSLGVSDLILSLSQVPLLQIGILVYSGLCLLLGAMATMLLMQGWLGRAGIVLTLGVAANILGDILFSLSGTKWGLITQNTSPLPYGVAAMLLTVAAWRLYQLEPHLPLRDSLENLPTARFNFQFLPYIAAFLACFLLVTSLPQSGLRERGILWGTALLIAFVMLRQWLSRLDEDQLRRELEESSAEVEHRAYHDSLTGLPNRAALEKLFAEDEDLLAGKPYAIFSMDLNGFKAINDTHGHQVGDLMLQHAAKQLGRAVADPGQVFRWGGDEFVIVMPGMKRETEARALANFIRVQIAAPMPYKDQELRVGTSVGYTLGRGASNYEMLLSLADSGMYRHKQRGAQTGGDLPPPAPL